MLSSFSMKTFNTCHNYLYFTTLKQSKFERVACQITSKDSVHTFQKVISRGNYMCLYAFNKLQLM